MLLSSDCGSNEHHLVVHRYSRYYFLDTEQFRLWYIWPSFFIYVNLYWSLLRSSYRCVSCFNRHQYINKYTFLFQPEYYRDAAHFHRVNEGPEYRLEIPQAKLDYTGTYTAYAKNCHGDAKAIISLQIFARGKKATYLLTERECVLDKCNQDNRSRAVCHELFNEFATFTSLQYCGYAFGPLFQL